MTLEELINGIDDVHTGIEIWSALKSFANGQGCERVAYQYYGQDRDWGEAFENLDEETRAGAVGDAIRSISPTLHIVAHGFPEDWINTYMDRRYYEINPIPEFAHSTTEPFMWSEAPSLIELTEKQVEFMKARDDMGLGDGIAVQVFGPNLRNGFVAFGFGEKKVRFASNDLREFQLAAQLMHLRVCKMIDEDPDGPREQLSPREKEVLMWIARGKSKSVIGDILGISAHTVDTNVRRIFRKLDVADRTSAALKGVAAGIIPAGLVGVT
jgi:LuxR family transcriptional regulator/LuxR family quorum-sensing system transcriptional regulator CciR